MIKFSKTRTFKLTVPVRIEDPETVDKVNEGSLIVEYKALQRSDFEKLHKAELTDRQFVESIVLGVQGLGDEEGIAYEPQRARALVIEDVGICAAVLKAFNEHYVKKKAGN